MTFFTPGRLSRIGAGLPDEIGADDASGRALPTGPTSVASCVPAGTGAANPGSGGLRCLSSRYGCNLKQAMDFKKPR